eukprot:CAMPEP_0202918820 /NCGR_PEP_ID=MMETSP1392-20130828/74300_1 /ASSEMBLY_ACC=CAM_ASM_000868 /TAXON_ID=225041 /ORGANISM="Chlamydomonas chlamydogama, Strain SAG 11-48b" /LENGTH=194 /DNA_ID=CAMNT_0049611975 /DNA_START=117 /DNA_END=697 /DNA_ORIENTATION=+
MGDAISALGRDDTPTDAQDTGLDRSSSEDNVDDEFGLSHLEGGGSSVFDPAVAARHGYLGDVDELSGGYVQLEEGEEYSLPVLFLEGVVLMPGGTLPLKLYRRGELQLLSTALRLKPPCTRVMVVVHWSGYSTFLQPRLVGCTAEIRGMRTQADGSVHLVARGRQRVVLDKGLSMDEARLRMKVRVLPEGAVPR